MFGRCCCIQPEDGHEQERFTGLGKRLSDWICQWIVFHTATPMEFPPAGERKALQVPPDFSIRSVDSNASPGAGYISLSEEQKAREMTKLQHMIRDFVMEFLQGVFLDAVLEDGSVVPCRCVMDSKLSVLMLQVHATTRTVDLTSIQESS
eukprot:g16316.t1